MDDIKHDLNVKARKPVKKWLGLPRWLWIVWTLAVGVAVIARGVGFFDGRAIANVISLIGVAVIVISPLVEFSLRSSYSRRTRMTALIGFLAALGVMAAMFRIDQVSGELIPTLALRFSYKPDQRLKTTGMLDRAAGPRPGINLTATTPNDFPQFLGPRRDMAVENVVLARDWNGRPPRCVWRQKIGAGWSGFAVVGDYAVTMQQRGDSEMVTCYELKTGRLCWAHAVATRYETILGGVGPRATPTIDQGMVYTLGAKADLLCLDGATGEVVWQKNLWGEFGITPDDEQRDVPYGRANSPLVVDDLLIVPAGGPDENRCVSLMAYDKRTGRTVWQGGQRQVGYSSPVLTTLGNVRQILIVNQDYAAGHDPSTGRVLWEHDWPGRSATNANVSQAVPIPPSRVFLSKGYSGGAMLIELLPRDDGTFDTRVIWSNSRVMRTKFTNAAMLDGYVYGLSDGILECVELATGQRVWKGGRYRHGQILRVGDLLLVLGESGELLLVEATPDRSNHVLCRLQALEGMTWNTLALSGPYLLVRNATEAACYELPLAKENRSTPKLEVDR